MTIGTILNTGDFLEFFKSILDLQRLNCWLNKRAIDENFHNTEKLEFLSEKYLFQEHTKYSRKPKDQIKGNKHRNAGEEY